jgi:hypothetical protein
LPGVLRAACARYLGIAAIAGSACWAGLAAAAASDDESAVNELSHDTAHAALIRGPLLRAQEALARARSMDRAGDTAHARLARALAHQWTRVALDLIRAASMEEKARQTEKSLDEMATKTVRGRALLEETAARRGRAKEALEQLEHEPPPPPPTAPKPHRTKVPPKPAKAPKEHE